MLDQIKNVANGTVDLVVCSPPYVIGKSYENAKTVSEYVEWMDKVVAEIKRTLKKSGGVCWQVGTHVSDEGEYLPLDMLFYPLFKKAGFILKNRVMWTFGSGLHSEKRLSGRYETLLWFVLGDKYTFNLDPIRVASKYPGKCAYKGPNKGNPSGNPLGKNPSDVWQIMMDEWEKSIWDFPNVKANHVEKNSAHPCQFPVELAERCVLAFSNSSDTILDPFCGLGSSGIAAVFHDRKFVGIDSEARYIQLARERIESALDGTLKTRKIGTAIAETTASSSLKQTPAAWKQAIDKQKSKKRIYDQYRQDQDDGD